MAKGDRTSGVIGITLGDAAGVGPEVVRAAIESGRLPRNLEYRIFGNADGVIPGHPTEQTARNARQALEEAAAAALRGEISAVVTGPIHKARMRAAGFEYPGQTEFFADRWGTSNFAMCLTGGKLTVALVTAHVPLQAVAGILTTHEIVRVGELLAAFVRQRRNAAGSAEAPRIAVAGLNPHAGESGMLGREEGEIIEPAVAALADRLGQSARLFGPLSPDTLFYRAVAGEFDGVLCMYHDQGLIPLKLHAFESGVNVTLGLPYPRTSPDHGTAFEIAGRNVASAESMIAAIELAAQMAEGARAPAA